MTREEVKELLQELGIEEPTKENINAMLSKIHQERKNAVAEELELRKDEMKDYVKKEDYDKLNVQYQEVTSKLTQNERHQNYLKYGVDPKYNKFVDSELKDVKAEELETKIKELFKSYPEWEQKKTDAKASNANEKDIKNNGEVNDVINNSIKTSLGNTATNSKASKEPLNLKEAITNYYSQN